MPIHWNCCVAGCFSNWRNCGKYYCVPTNAKLQQYYKAFLKTDGVNWLGRPNICSKHWSSPRKNYRHLPDIRLPELARRGNSSREKRFKKFQQKKASIARSTRQQDRFQDKQVASQFREKKEKISLERENERLRSRVAELERKLEDFEKIKAENAELAELLMRAEKQSALEFSFDGFTDLEFQLFIGQNREEFTTLLQCFKPFIHLIKYEACTTNMKKKTKKENELLAVLAICRHALPLSVMAWLLGISPSTMSRIFEAWICFGTAIFSKIDIQPPRQLINSMMPEVFKNLGYSHISLVLDATEFKIQRFSDLNLNTLFFSDYKQTHTAKALVCLAPHGALTAVPDLYPGSITDSDITKITGALDSCLIMDGILTDKGFAISELAAEKGAEHNRPPMKSQDQFSAGETDDNFKIACLRIHVERWIGYLRNYKILNEVWPCNRIDLLNCTWQFLAYMRAAGPLVKPKY